MERRLSFGEDAERYDRARPSYPAEVIDAVVEGDVRRVVDVGCGTGIAARLIAERGCTVLGVEADERMAAVARARGTEVVVSSFESWTPPTEPFDAVTAAQAWHWVDPKIGPAKAAEVLRPGGRLALFWNGYEQIELHDELRARYRQLAPWLIDSSIVLGPQEGLARHIGPIDATGCFGPVAQVDVRWTRAYARDEWLDQLPTHSDHRALPPDVLAAVLEAVAEVIDANGGSVAIEHTTRLLLASRR